jgi:sugar phosphate permease
MTESDNKKAYQEYLKEKTFRTVVIHFAIKNKCFYQICGRYIRCYVLPVISDAWVHAYINVQHICTLIRRAG